MMAVAALLLPSILSALVHPPAIRAPAVRVPPLCMLDAAPAPPPALDQHAQRVAKALSASEVERAAYRRGSNRVPNGASASARPDLSRLRAVLSVSRDDATITAEPGVTMEELVAAALPLGLLPKVVPEFRGITVGGAIIGGAMESSSFVHGMFHDTVSSCELCLPNGTVAVASRSVNADLLAALGGSYGTLASLTAATIECVRLPTRSTTAVRVTFEWYADVAEGVAALNAMARARSCSDGRRIDFLDGVALPDGGVLVCIGRLVDDDAEYPVETWSVGGPGDEFYFEKLWTCEAASRRVEALTMRR